MRIIKNKNFMLIVLFAVFLYMSSLCTVVHADDATIRGSGYIGNAPDEETPPEDKKENLDHKNSDTNEIVVSKTNTSDDTRYYVYEKLLIISGVIVILGAMHNLLNKDETI